MNHNNLKIVDCTLRTFDWNDEVLIEPTTKQIKKSSKNIDLLVMNSLNLNWQVFHSYSML